MMKDEHICEHPSCDDTGTTPCIVIAYRGEFLPLWFLRVYGLRRGAGLLWRMAWDGCVELPPEHYCAEHAKEHGYCWGCGYFWSGCENFDFSPSIFCPNCRESECDDDFRDEWLALWENYPGELLEVSDV